MTRRYGRWARVACIAGLVTAAAFSGGCNDLVSRSIRDGMFAAVSGGITDSLGQGGSMSTLLNTVLTGTFFSGTSDDSTNGS